MDDVLLILENFIGNVWGLFTGVDIPGLGMNAGQLFIALVVISFSLRLIALFTGMGTDIGSSAERMRTSNEKIGQYRKAIEQKKRNERKVGF